MGFNKSTLFFISKILYLSYCKIDNQTSELCNFTQVKSVFFIMAYQFSGKKMGGKNYFEMYITMIGNFIWKMTWDEARSALVETCSDVLLCW